MSSAVGTFVKADDIVARIETDKVTVDILSAHTGVITKYHAKEGDTVPVGANFMDIDTAAAAGSAQPQAAAAPKKEAAPQVSKLAPPLLIIIILIGCYAHTSCLP
jgi:2-oxoglutarate dehydrogenase E2 component (dihydrolipoamide succinyltransferase)